MKYTPPARVELNEVEQEAFGKIKEFIRDQFSHEWDDVAQWQQWLVQELMQRFPEKRTCLIEGAHVDHYFPEKLVYLVEGPALPSLVMQSFCDQLNKPFGDDPERVLKWVRECVKAERLYGLEDEFFRLAIEVGLSDILAKLVREQAMIKPR